MHSPNSDSSAAVASQASFLRAVMYTRQPCAHQPAVAIIAPMPRDPPVTTATLPATPNRAVIVSAGLDAGPGLAVPGLAVPGFAVPGFAVPGFAVLGLLSTPVPFCRAGALARRPLPAL